MRFDIKVHLTIHYLPFLLLKALNKNLPSFFVVEHSILFEFSYAWPMTIVFGEKFES